jgi:beta-lactamase class A
VVRGTLTSKTSEMAVTRRAVVLSLAAFSVSNLRTSTALAQLTKPAIQAQVASLEARNGGRLGVFILDTASGESLERRADERFPLTSTFKFLAAAAVLKLIDAGDQRLDRLITYTEADIEPGYSPVTKRNVATGMTIADLCAAAVAVSDNTAGNLLLSLLGGPQGLTGFCRSLGDQVTRLDRTEPTLNSALPGDARDTTSPRAMAENLKRLLLGDVLTPASRQQLEAWLIDDKVGGKRLRAGIPTGWRIGDKTGSGENGTANIVGILWPTAHAPVLAAVYYTGSSAPREQLDAVHAEIGRILGSVF